MRREERVTVQGPVKEQQPDGMSHGGGGGGGTTNIAGGGANHRIDEYVPCGRWSDGVEWSSSGPTGRGSLWMRLDLQGGLAPVPLHSDNADEPTVPERPSVATSPDSGSPRRLPLDLSSGHRCTASEL